MNSVRHDAVPRDDVLRAAFHWARSLRDRHPEIVRIGCFGSYVRGDYGPGSDLDVLIEVTEVPAIRRIDRADSYRPDRFPVGLELFVYSTDEITHLRTEGSSFLAAMEGGYWPLD